MARSSPLAMLLPVILKLRQGRLADPANRLDLYVMFDGMYLLKVE
jgi:hypothetical protein